MIRLILLFLLYRSCCSAELAACNEDSHCPSDFYCERDAFACRQCLRCEDYGRSTSQPIASTSCVRSVVECGPCLEGLNYVQGNVKEKCMLHDTTEELIPIYAWIIICVCLIAIIYLIVHLLCKTRILNKIVYSVTCSATQQPQGTRRNDFQLTASAPQYSDDATSKLFHGNNLREAGAVSNRDYPPFYNTLYPVLENEPLMHDQEEIPQEPANIVNAIKIPRRSYNRESSDHHSAVVFNKAIYENDSHSPNNLTPTPAVGASQDISLSQLDGNIQNNTTFSESGGSNLLAITAPDTNALVPVGADEMSTSPNNDLLSITYPTGVSNCTVPTTTTPTITQDPSTVINGVTCILSTTSMDQDNATTVVVQNMNIVQVKKKSCRKSRSTF